MTGKLAKRIGGDGPQEPPPPPNPARDLHNGISSVMAVTSMPGEFVNEGFAKVTAGIAKVWPTFPAATILSPAVGLPHGHLPLGIPLPVIGMVLVGCSVTVLINGLPAARSGDMGLNPTCLGLPVPGFEIFTGSSKVFIGGSRAARMFDITKHCWPPAPKWTPKTGFATKLTKVGQAVMKGQAVMGKIGLGVQGLGVVADDVDSAQVDDPALAEAHALAAKTGAAQLAMDVAAMALGKLIGKNPCIGPPTGAIMFGVPNVLVGGFPVPNLMAMIGRKLASAKLPPKKPKPNPKPKPNKPKGPSECSR